MAMSVSEFEALSVESTLKQLRLSLADCTGDTCVYLESISEEMDKLGIGLLAAAEKKHHTGLFLHAIHDGYYVWSLIGEMSPGEAAQARGVSKQAVYGVLQDEARRREIFPTAFKMGEGKRGIWILDAEEVLRWQPRAYDRTK